MTDTALHREIGSRVATWLRQRHPRNTAKLSAAEVGVAVVTARKWLDGRPPSTVHLAGMLQRYGAGFAAFVLEPLGTWTGALRVAGTIEEIERQLDELDVRSERARTDLAALRSELEGDGA